MIFRDFADPKLFNRTERLFKKDIIGPKHGDHVEIICFWWCVAEHMTVVA